MTTWVWRRLRWGDLALAAAFVAFALVEEYVVRMPGGWWPYVLGLCTGLVLFRRSVPLLAMLVNSVAAARVFYEEATVSYRLWQLVAMIIAAFTVGRMVPALGTGWRSRGRSALGALFVIVTALLYWDNDRTDPMAAFFFTFAPYGLGLAVAAQARRMTEAAATRAAIREQQARAAVTDERLRIARELHDVVAHSVTVMGAAPPPVGLDRLDAGIDVDPELLRGIESAGREAVGELRRTLALLRGGDGDAAPPPVGLDRLDELVAQVRESGLAVTVLRLGEQRTLRPATDVSAYRIVQEALTNVLKHAGRASVTIELDYRPDGLHLSVVDAGGRPVGADPGSLAGQHGLIGMRERVMAFGGDLSAGPRPGGGFAVRARLPHPAQVSP